jgi:hypothetical protein
VEEQLTIYIYVVLCVFTVALVRHKICVLYLEKSTSYLNLKATIFLENKTLVFYRFH